MRGCKHAEKYAWLKSKRPILVLLSLLQRKINQIQPDKSCQPQKEHLKAARDELEVRGMLAARGMRVTDIMEAKFGADTYAPEKM